MEKRLAHDVAVPEVLRRRQRSAADRLSRRKEIESLRRPGWAVEDALAHLVLAPKDPCQAERAGRSK
jgi:hypothetical protein